MQTLIASALTLIVGALAGYLSAYTKKKGENLAIKEDLDDLVNQMSAVTTATKAIESQIEGRAWDRQQQGDLKKKALISALQALQRADIALMAMGLAYEQARKNGEQSEAEWRDKQWETMIAWQEAIGKLDDKRVVVNIACDKRSIDALRVASKGMRSNASKLFKKSLNSYDEMGSETQKDILDAFSAARFELGIDEHSAAE